MFYDDELTPHRKKSKRKTPTKADHKHNFEPCVFEYNGVMLDKAHGFIPKPDVKIGEYCTICGKIGSVTLFDKWMQWVPVKQGSRIGRSEYTEEAMREIDPNTRTLPTFKLEDEFRQKYVVLQNGGIEK